LGEGSRRLKRSVPLNARSLPLRAGMFTRVVLLSGNPAVPEASVR